MTINRIYGGYHIGSSSHLSDEQLRQLIDLFGRPPQKAVSPLEGRSSTYAHNLIGIGSIVIKYYTRGGLINHLVKHRYLKFVKTRSQKEFELLQKVRDVGINAPEPIVQASRGGLIYRAWLATRKIRKPISLARLSIEDIDKTGEAMKSVTDQISLLIRNRILHVDMHPGNVLVDSGGKVYLLDFDKGRNYHGSSEKLAQRYITRWQRAVVKHRLPLTLNEMMLDGLGKKMS